MKTYVKKLMNAVIDAFESSDWIVLDKLLRLYHKEIAKSHGIDVYAYQWFVKLTKTCPTCELQRSAVDILAEGQRIYPKQMGESFKAPYFLREELKNLIGLMKASDAAKSEDPVWGVQSDTSNTPAV